MNALTPLDAEAATRGARWFDSLRVRLALAIALTVTATVAVTGWLSFRVSEQVVVQEVAGTVTRTAELIARELEALPALPPRNQLGVRLQEIDATAGQVSRIAVVTRGGQGVIVAGTSGPPPTEEGLRLAIRAIAEARTLTEETAATVRTATPLRRAGAVIGAVVVRADVAPVLALQQRALSGMVWVAILATVVLVLGVDQLARPLVYRPIRRLRETMARVGAGDLSARAPVSGGDELAAVARGLNRMLSHMENFNDALQWRVREATAELERRNVERVESYHRLLAVREQLASAEQMASIGQTAANVAHQVGTPLNLISGHVQLLREHCGGDAGVTRRLDVIEEQIAKVTATVRTLLDRSRPLGPRTRTSARELVARVADAAHPNLEAAHIALELTAPATVTEIVVDAVNLELALLNMVNNAVYAMPHGGRLAIRISTPAPDVVRIAIADQGAGIPPDLLARIFEPWFTTKPKGRGTGLGLSIARDVIQAHGGSITVASEEGHGTTFTIDLPAAGRREAATATS